MIELNDRADQFLHSILAEGEKSCAAIRAETDKQVEDTLAAAAKQEQARAARVAAFEKERAQTAANRALSEAGTQVRTTLAQRRSRLAADVFTEVGAKLAAFTATPDYAPWLCQSAAKLCAKLGQGTALYARGQDLPLLKNAVPAGCALKPDDGITIGGLRAQNGDLAADDTLQARLAAQWDWFLQNADLTIAL